MPVFWRCNAGTKEDTTGKRLLARHKICFDSDMMIRPGEIKALSWLTLSLLVIPLANAETASIQTDYLSIEVSVAGMPKDLLDVATGEGMDLPGGWKKLPVQAGREVATGHRRHLRSGDSYSLVVGKIRPIRSGIRHWLSRHGFRDRPDLALQSILTGLDIQVQSLKGRQARLSVRPWIRREADDHEYSTINHHSGVLVPPGVINQQSTQVWVGAYPFRDRDRDERQVDIDGAETEFIISVGDIIELAAIRDEAMGFGEAALSSDPDGFHKFLIIRIRLNH